jgi:hypothetical protein
MAHFVQQHLLARQEQAGSAELHGIWGGEGCANRNGIAETPVASRGFFDYCRDLRRTDGATAVSKVAQQPEDDVKLAIREGSNEARPTCLQRPSHASNR